MTKSCSRLDVALGWNSRAGVTANAEPDPHDTTPSDTHRDARRVRVRAGATSDARGSLALRNLG